jgi:TorA maturation chaperone TorD
MSTAAAEPVTTAELARVMRDRAATYNLLARLYRSEVDEPLLAELRSMRFPSRTGTAAVDKGYRLIRDYLASSWENVLTELAVDYARTFIGHGNTAYSAAYPYESVYTSARRLLMQDARTEVVALYRAAGKDKAPDWKEPEDHVALELEFEGYLCERAAEALDAEDGEAAYALVLQQRAFLEDHLLNWTPMMLADLDRFAQTDFYRGVGQLTLGVLKSEKALLAELLADEAAA